jgi:hypothetical protein
MVQVLAGLGLIVVLFVLAVGCIKLLEPKIKN